jgi:hypothetical protein
MKDLETKYQKDSPETYEQALDLLKDYYKTQKANGDHLPLRPAIASWKLNEDGTMTVIDGASGRKLSFVIDTSKQDKLRAEAAAEDAAQAAADALAKAEAARLAADAAEAEAKAAVKTEKAKGKPR